MARINLPRSRFVKNPEPQISIAETYWTDARESVNAVNPELADIIDHLDSKYPLVISEYDYGSIIANQQTNLQPSLVLQNNCELFFDYQNHQPIHRVYEPGEIIFPELACWPNNWFYQNHFWKLSAGCRNVFMLPKITAHQSHKALLRQYEISTKKPLSLNEHWQVFKLIANSRIHDQDQRWKVKILSFGKEWFNHRTDPAWQRFYQYFERTALQHHEVNCQKPLIDTLIGILQHEKHIKTALPHAEQANYLIQILLGGSPGFTPICDENSLPLKLITEAYVEHYGLKEYAPIIMGPSYINKAPSLYYSFNHPTSHLISPVTNQRKTLVQNTLMVHWVFNKIRDLLLNAQFVPKESSLYQALELCNVDFYHDEAVNYPPFKLPESIIKDDLRFMENWPKQQLQAHSHFLNGCVRIFCEST